MDRPQRIRAFFDDPRPPHATAAFVLRRAFVAAFLGQSGVAALVGGVLILVAGGREGPAPWLGTVVVAGSAAATAASVAVAAGGVRSATAATRRLSRDVPSRAPSESASGGPAPEPARDAFASALRAARSAVLSALLLAAILAATPVWLAALALLGGDRGAALAGCLGLAALAVASGLVHAERAAMAVRLPPARDDAVAAGRSGS